MNQEHQQEEESALSGLRARTWRESYRTSSTLSVREPVDILQDFYIPALSRSVRYDRMAGYFRSTSLAAASQGFSTFVGREGGMRLIVGADLEPADVQAILEGDNAKLENSLKGELEQRDGWPENVVRGVELLAYMVAQGCLEVKVAFRTHSKTGEPLNFDQPDDGYVHEKWAIFTDEADNRLYATGSLNESKTALTINAENLEVFCDWWGERDARRVESAQEAFERTWNNENPHLELMTLPEAVRNELLNMAKNVHRPHEIDGTSAAPKKIPPPSAEEWLRFAILRDAPKMPGGRYVGMYTAPVKPWPHQEVVARRLIKTWPYSYLLCDEVGLGKTIEAGLAIRSLWLSGLVKRILIAPPASLTRQWQREMESKFMMPFGRALTGPTTKHSYLLPFEQEVKSGSIYDPDLAIVSNSLLARRERQQELRSAIPFDIALIDEAHYARRKNPTDGTTGVPEYGLLYHSIDANLRRKSKALWMATATPMQLDPIEACDLVRLTNRAGTFQFDPSLTTEYYDILGRLVRNAKVTEEQLEFIRSSITSVKTQDPFLWNHIEKAVIDNRIRRATDRWLQDKRRPNDMDMRNMLRLLFAASPLSRVMLRHTRPLLEIYREHDKLEENLAQRKILPVPRITFTEQERAAYEDLDKYCKDLRQKIEAGSSQSNRTNLHFYLSLLRLRLASSLYAINETLKRRQRKVKHTLKSIGPQEMISDIDLESAVNETEIEDDSTAVESLLKNRNREDLEWEYERIEEMLSRYDQITEKPSKTKELLRALERRRKDGRFEQTVIFTRFHDTLCDIRESILKAEPRVRIGTYSGQGGVYMDTRTWKLKRVERDEIKHRFLRGEIDILICTDAAAEGLNLQTADLLINFDLPWNPMKVEQRIGRIDRIGQKHEQIYVLNLAYAGSVEQIVYERLLNRLSEARNIVGRQQFSMLPVTADEFEELAEQRITPRELEERAAERIGIQEKRSESMEIPPRDLYEIYTRISTENTFKPLSADLSAVEQTLSESNYLENLGCAKLVDTNGDGLKVEGIPDIPSSTILTTSRHLYENGLQDYDGILRFASYGEPAFETILQLILQFECPKCIRRLAVQHEHTDCEIVGYLVGAKCQDGPPQPKLITHFAQIEELGLVEDIHISEEDISKAKSQLKRLTDKELGECVAVKRVEESNVQFGRAQLVLNYATAKFLMDSRCGMSNSLDNFWDLLRDIHDTISGRDRIIAQPISADILRPIADKTSFKISVPQFGEEGSVEATSPLLEASLEAATRLANSLKVRKSECTTDKVMHRLNNRIEKLNDKLLKVFV